MQPLSPPPEAAQARPGRARAAFVALTALAGLAGADAASAADPCPWVVQPQPEPILATGADQKASTPAFQLMFDGLAQEVGAFYGFSVASMDLASEFAGLIRLPDLSTDARPLEPAGAALGTGAYRVAADTIEPHVVYLVTAPAPVEQLEKIKARIEPERPVAVAMRTRGASDLSGPLPHRSVPGFLVASAEGKMVPNLQICAYQVAIR